MPESHKQKKARSAKILECLRKEYPPVTTFLTHETPFQLLIAVILSAQCTDARVNQVTPGLFAKYPDAPTLANADYEQVAHCIKSINFFPTKARNSIATAQQLCTAHHGNVPDTLDALIQLPGVGRKTANVLLGQAFGKPGITVDTHVNRLSKRLGFSTEKDPYKIELDLQKLWPSETWTDFSSWLIVHGRTICKARKPACMACCLSIHCPSSEWDSKGCDL